MDIKISFQNMDHSGAVENHTKEKLEKLHELLKRNDDKPPFFIEIWLKANKLHPHHKAELHLKTSLFDLHSHDENPDMYTAIDNAVDKMVTIVKKEKSKKQDRKSKQKNEKQAFAENDDKYTLS